MDVKTIVCPNCGVSTSNFHNCEYCGSFLVQKVSQGYDLSGYVNNAKKYDATGLTSVLHKFLDCGKRASFKEPEMSVFGLLVVAKGNGDEKPFIDCVFADAESGMYIQITEHDMKERGILSHFFNSNVMDLFTVRKGACDIWNEEVGSYIKYDLYEVDFGYDYAGAALLITQLIEEVFNSVIDKNSITYKIYCVDSFDHFSLYNKQGKFIKGKGDGENEFVSFEQALKEFHTPTPVQAPVENLEDDENDHTEAIVYTVIAVIVLILFFVFLL